MNTIRSIRGVPACFVMLLLVFHPLLVTTAEGQGHRKSGDSSASKSTHAPERGTEQQRRMAREEDATHTDCDDDDDDCDDVEDEEVDRGPWKVAVPPALRRAGVGLMLRGRYIPLDRQSVRLRGGELPELVSLIGPGGRVLERRKRLVTEHLLTGFHERRFRISGAWGFSAMEGAPVRSKILPRIMLESGIEGLYQPSALGFVLGLHTASGLIEQEKSAASDHAVQVQASELRIGACWEFGLAPRSAYYRWHGLVQGGVLLGSASRERVREDTSNGASNTEPHTGEDEDDEQAMARRGVYAAFDAVYLWQSWWWGGRLLFKTQSLSTDEDDHGGWVSGHGVQIVGSYTW